VEIYTLDPLSTKRRGVRDAQELYLSYDQIEVEDIKLVRNELDLSDASEDNANILHSEFGTSWIVQLLNMTNEEITAFCEEKRGHKGSIMALQRKLMRLALVPGALRLRVLAEQDGGEDEQRGEKRHPEAHEVIADGVPRRPDHAARE